MFRELIKSDTRRVLEGLSSSGFQGVEIGSRFFGIDERDRLVGELAASGMEMSGMHVGASYDEWSADWEQAAARVVGVAQFVQGLPNKNVILSAGKPSGEIDLPAACAHIDEAARRCGELGVTLCYHNHWWEFENNRLIYSTLLERAPHLMLAPDLGWLYAAGYDPEDFIRENAPRIAYAHLRDVKADRKTFAELGEGDMDLAAIVSLLDRTLPQEGWVVVEYEEGEQDFSRYQRAHLFVSRLPGSRW